jgi:hypothetical protein
MASSSSARPHRSYRAPAYPRVAALGAVGVALMASGCPRPLPPPPGIPPQMYTEQDASAEAPVEKPEQPVTVAASPDMQTGLRAVLSPDKAAFVSSVEGQLTAEITNEGTDPAELRMDVLAVGIFSLDVFDSAGKRIPTIPPPMPLTPEEVEQAKELLPPGQSRRIEYTLHMFSPPLPAGTYTAKLRDIPCEAVTFTITGAP